MLSARGVRLRWVPASSRIRRRPCVLPSGVMSTWTPPSRRIGGNNAMQSFSLIQSSTPRSDADDGSATACVDSLSEAKRVRHRLAATNPDVPTESSVVDVTPETTPAPTSPLTHAVLKVPRSTFCCQKGSCAIQVVLFACLGAFLFGYHLGVVNGPLGAIAEDLGFPGNEFLQGTVVSSLLAGAAVGSLSGGRLADSLGRRRTLGLDSVLMILGAVLSAGSTNLAFMVAGRLVTGIAIGISSAIVPLFISEVSPTAVRGALGSVNQLVICIGILGAVCVNVILPAAEWRTMFLLSIIPALLLAMGMALSPESPRWLLSVGRKTDATAVMQQLWGEVDADLKASDDTAAPKGAALVLTQRHVSVLAVACALFLFQQFSGINAIIYYSTEVFSKAGIANKHLATAAVGATNVCGTIFASTLMDRAGRKQLLSWSYLGMGIAMGAMALGFSQPALAAYSGGIALMGTLVYILSFGLGVGPIPGRAVSYALTTHWVTNCIIGQLFLPAVEAMGIPLVYSFFALVSLAAILFVQRYVVETKGKSLEEIELAMLG